MCFLARVVAVGVVCASVVALPALAAAQSKLTGRLVEQLPSGNPYWLPFISLRLLASNGSTVSFKSLNECETGETTDCIAADGSFSAVALADGLYLFVATDGFLQDRFLNVNVSGNTNMGDVLFTRRQFNVETTLGTIPAAGGDVPVTVRVRTNWNILDLPISVRLAVSGDNANTEFRYELPFVINATWPAGLTDSGPVSLPPIHVLAADPVGIHRCVEVIITTQGNPRLVLTGGSMRCGVKQP